MSKSLRLEVGPVKERTPLNQWSLGTALVMTVFVGLLLFNANLSAKRERKANERFERACEEIIALRIAAGR